MNQDPKYDLLDVETHVILNFDPDEASIRPLSWAGVVSLQSQYHDLTGRDACIKGHGLAEAALEIDRFDLLIANLGMRNTSRVVLR